MKFRLKDIPRYFKPRKDKDIVIADCGEVFLEANEQVSFVTPSGKPYDFAAKDWGFYATPSVNSRLKNEGFKTALITNEFGQVYVMVVDIDKMDLFETYCKVEQQTILEWLDERKLNND